MGNTNIRICNSSADTVTIEQLKNCEITVGDTNVKKVISFFFFFGNFGDQRKGNKFNSVDFIIDHKPEYITLWKVKATEGSKTYNCGQRFYYLKW